MANESDAAKSGIRMYDITYPTGERFLVVAFLVGGEEVLRIPGAYVSRLRALLQRVEADHAGRTGSAEGVEEIPRETVFSGGTDPGKATLN